VPADGPEIFKWLEQTTFGASVRESLWLFPGIETVHLLAMSLLVISIAAFDLRLMGLAMPGVRVSELARRIFPWAWTAFAVQVVTGFLLFSSEATRMAVNPAFRIKMVLIALAGVHAAVFRWIACRDMTEWVEERATPIRAKIAGGISIFLWVGVVAAGRWIGFI
jgi:hypothetical protein